MKRCRAILLVLVVLTALLAACTKNDTPTGTPSQTSGTASTPTPVPTTAPDFSSFDFSGVWVVSALYDSDGQTVSPEDFEQMGADFTLELSQSSAYFLYNAQQQPIGQGQYRVTKNEVILTAAGAQTVYTIQDENTLRCTSEDGSVTVMTRLADVNEEEAEAPSDDTDFEDTDTDEP